MSVERMKAAIAKAKASADNDNYCVNITIGECQNVLDEVERLQAENMERRMANRRLRLELEKCVDVFRKHVFVLTNME